MKLFPESTLAQIEFDKVKALLAAHCRTSHSAELATNLRIHTRIDFIEEALRQTEEFKGLLMAGLYFPNEFTQNIGRELKLASIPGAALSGDQFLLIRKLAENTSNIFRWFGPERREAFKHLAALLSATNYEKAVIDLIDEVLDEVGIVKDSASEALASIRVNIFRKRQELRRAFERIASRYNKLGYLADIEESFLNGRRVLAVVAENKRMIKGVLHGESDSRRTSYIEPEETTELNNALFSLEYEEGREVNRILRELTSKMNKYSPWLHAWYILAGDFDFIRARALLAIEMNAFKPVVKDKALVNLMDAYHPLLLLYNKKNGKITVPVTLKLDENNRILVISGPNAGGKTVTLKTIGLLQVMMQSGLLVSVSPDSEMGIFKQMFIHIGDTQSLEFELSTYSSQLKNMKYFMENANGKTMFFIDELGSGSDPNLGGAFAEVIMEELARKHAMGIVTTHYLNLKVMANKVKGIVNGAMQFDERKLLPLYKLQVGKPGSSYTFSIAERIGLNKELIVRARTLVDEEHFKLDRLLNRTEQDLQKIDKEKGQLQKLLKENERLKKEMQDVIEKESHRQEMEKIRTQNKLSEEKLIYLKEMERKLKSMIVEWRRADDKQKVVQMIQALLFKQKDKLFVSKQQKKIDEKFEEIGGEVRVGATVKMKHNRQVGTVKEIRGKSAVLQVGIMPMTVKMADLVVIREKPGD